MFVIKLCTVGALVHAGLSESLLFRHLVYGSTCYFDQILVIFKIFEIIKVSLMHFPSISTIGLLPCFVCSSKRSKLFYYFDVIIAYLFLLSKNSKGKVVQKASRLFT